MYNDIERVFYIHLNVFLPIKSVLRYNKNTLFWMVIKMYEMLYRFFNGDVRPCEMPYPKDGKINLAWREFDRAQESLRAQLNPAQAALLEELLLEQVALNAAMEETYFVRGLRFGAQFCVELLFPEVCGAAE